MEPSNINNHADLVKTLKNLSLGLRRGTLKLSTPSKKWAEAFSTLHTLLAPKLPECQLIHVGGTAIPECASKPILDVIIWHKPESDFQAEKNVLVNAGFTAKGKLGLTGGKLFTLYDEAKEVDFVHVHAFPFGHRNGQEIESFCKKLKQNPSLALEYKERKKALIETGISRKNYPNAKTKLIKRILENEMKAQGKE